MTKWIHHRSMLWQTEWVQTSSVWKLIVKISFIFRHLSLSEWSSLHHFYQLNFIFNIECIMRQRIRLTSNGFDCRSSHLVIKHGKLFPSTWSNDVIHPTFWSNDFSPFGQLFDNLIRIWSKSLDIWSNNTTICSSIWSSRQIGVDELTTWRDSTAYEDIWLLRWIE